MRSLHARSAGVSPNAQGVAVANVSDGAANFSALRLTAAPSCLEAAKTEPWAAAGLMVRLGPAGMWVLALGSSAARNQLYATKG